jgi:hypothetical protein
MTTRRREERRPPVANGGDGGGRTQHRNIELPLPSTASRSAIHEGARSNLVRAGIEQDPDEKLKLLKEAHSQAKLSGDPLPANTRYQYLMARRRIEEGEEGEEGEAGGSAREGWRVYELYIQEEVYKIVHEEMKPLDVLEVGLLANDANVKAWARNHAALMLKTAKAKSAIMYCYGCC